MDDREGDDEREEDPAEIGIADAASIHVSNPRFPSCYFGKA
jgi:hypothetical protein